jgi:hypothetical protein
MVEDPALAAAGATKKAKNIMAPNMDAVSTRAKLVMAYLLFACRYRTGLVPFILYTARNGPLARFADY